MQSGISPVDVQAIELVLARRCWSNVWTWTHLLIRLQSRQIYQARVHTTALLALRLSRRLKVSESARLIWERLECLLWLTELSLLSKSSLLTERCLLSKLSLRLETLLLLLLSTLKKLRLWFKSLLLLLLLIFHHHLHLHHLLLSLLLLRVETSHCLKCRILACSWVSMGILLVHTHDVINLLLTCCLRLRLEPCLLLLKSWLRLKSLGLERLKACLLLTESLLLLLLLLVLGKHLVKLVKCRHYRRSSWLWTLEFFKAIIFWVRRRC